MTVNKYTLLDETMEKINFENIHALMTLRNHTWHNNNGIPTIEELRSHLYTLAQSIDMESNKSYQCVASGGFRLELIYWNPGDSPTMRITFYLESRDTKAE